jgi:hypothetical protein
MMCAVARMNSTDALEKLATYGVRANWTTGSETAAGSTISPTRPDASTRSAS